MPSPNFSRAEYEIDTCALLVRKMRERGSPDPARARGESGDSDIEEVGRTYRQLPEAHGSHSLASSSFDWGSSSFTSTLDVDAIKVLITPAPTQAPTYS